MGRTFQGEIVNYEESVQCEREILAAFVADDLDWTHLMKLFVVLEANAELMTEQKIPLPPGYIAMSHILFALCSIPMQQNMTTSQKKNELWRFLGLGKASIATEPRDSCIYGTVVLMRALGKSDKEILDFGFTDIDVPESVIQAQISASKEDTDHLRWLEGCESIEAAISHCKQMAVFNSSWLPQKGPKPL